MKYVIIGGDERSLRLCRLLKCDGDDVACCAVENAALPMESHCDGDVYVLPLPIERGGVLNAPLSGERLRLSELFSRLPKGAFAVGGMPSEAAFKQARYTGIRLYDYMSDPRLTVGNAAITAEAAIAILMSATQRCISGKNVLVIGGGRIGKLLISKLRGLGAIPWLLTGNAETAALAEAMGVRTFSPNGEASMLDMAVNTAPATVLSEDMQRNFKGGTPLLELASASGFEPSYVSHCKLINAPGLPAKYAPETAAELIAAAVKMIVKEHYHE